MDKSIVFEDLSPTKRIRNLPQQRSFLNIRVRNSTLDGSLLKSIVGIAESGATLIIETCRLIKLSKLEDSNILNIHELRIYSSEVEEFSGLLHQNLEIFHAEAVILRANRVLDFSKSPNLKELSIESCYNFTIIISPLNRILRYIWIPDQDHELRLADTTYGYVHSLNLSNFESISPEILKNFPNLTTLYYFDNYLDDPSLQYIRQMKNLQDLRICGDNLSKFPVLDAGDKLQQLYVENSLFSDYSALKNYTNLRDLSLSNSILFDVDLDSILKNLSQLESVWLNDSLLIKCPDFSGNEQLMKLDISENLISSLDSLQWILDVPRLQAIILQKNIFSMNLYGLLNVSFAMLKEIVGYYKEFKQNQSFPLQSVLKERNSEYLNALGLDAWVYSRFLPAFLLLNSLNIGVDILSVDEFLEVFGDYVNFFINWKIKIIEAIATGVATTAQIEENIDMDNGLDLLAIHTKIDSYILKKIKSFNGFNEFEQLLKLYYERKANTQELKQKLSVTANRLFKIHPKTINKVKKDLYKYYERSLLLEHEEIPDYIQEKVNEASPEDGDKAGWKRRISNFKQSLLSIKESLDLMKKFDANEDLIQDDFMNNSETEESDRKENDEEINDVYLDRDRAREYKSRSDKDEDEDSEEEDEDEDEDSEEEDEDEDEDSEEEDEDEDSETDEENARTNPYSLYITADSFPGALKFENFVFTDVWKLEEERACIEKFRGQKMKSDFMAHESFENNPLIQSINIEFLKYLLYLNYCKNTGRNFQNQ